MIVLMLADDEYKLLQSALREYGVYNHKMKNLKERTVAQLKTKVSFTTEGYVSERDGKVHTGYIITQPDGTPTARLTFKEAFALARANNWLFDFNAD